MCSFPLILQEFSPKHTRPGLSNVELPWHRQHVFEHQWSVSGSWVSFFSFSSLDTPVCVCTCTGVCVCVCVCVWIWKFYLNFLYFLHCLLITFITGDNLYECLCYQHFLIFLTSVSTLFLFWLWLSFFLFFF